MSPAIGENKALQGVGASLSDLTLHDGRKLAVKFGGNVAPTPELTRTTAGAAGITIPVNDPNYRLLRDSLLSTKFDCAIEGLPFRYLGLTKSGERLTIKLIDRRIARLQEFFGPKRALREPTGKDKKGTTRAEFLKSLFDEALPGFEFYCPQLHDIQPIKSAAQGKKASEAASEKRGKGIGATKGLKVKGDDATPEQLTLGDDALRIAESVNAPAKVRLALIEALIVETEMGADDPGNPLQATPASKSESNESDIHRFLTGGWGVDPTGNGAIGYSRANPGKSAGEVAQAVQGSAYPGRYDGVSSEALEWVEAFEGGDLSGSETVSEPYRFEVKPEENYWTAAKRIAGEVKWKLFLLPERAVYMDEEELVRSQVRLAIDANTPGIEDLDFDFNVNKKVTTVTVTALVAQWSPPPGTVVTVADYGPASIGSGDAPLKASEKGKPHLASAVKASTHEGKGRYFVESIATPLTKDATGRKAKITLKKPSRPLPEPASAAKTLSAGASATGSVAGNEVAEAMLSAAEREAAKREPYRWEGGHDAGFTGPYDCSGGVSMELHVGGFLDSPETTVGLAGFGQAGEGDLITVYVKTSGGAEEEHTAIKIGDDVFESGGGGENTNPNGGWGKVDSSQVAAFLKQFDTKRHPKGF